MVLRGEGSNFSGGMQQGQKLRAHEPFLVFSNQNFSPSAPRLPPSPEPDDWFFLSSPSSSSDPEEMVWMSSLSLAVPGACPARCSPSLSVLLDSVSTSWGQEQLLGCIQASSLFPGNVVFSSSSPPPCSRKPFGMGSPLWTPHPTGQCLNYLWDFGGAAEFCLRSWSIRCSKGKEKTPKNRMAFPQMALPNNGSQVCKLRCQIRPKSPTLLFS